LCFAKRSKSPKSHPLSPAQSPPPPSPVIELPEIEVWQKDPNNVREEATLKKIKIDCEPHIDKSLLPNVLDWQPFKTWSGKVKNIPIHSQPPFIINKVTFQSLDMKKRGNEVLFAKVKVNYDLWDKKNFKYTNKDGFMFMRGSSVAILVVLIDRDTNEQHVVLTQQVRMPVGIADFREIPAGVVDKGNKVAVQAQVELREETGLEIKSEQLLDLTALITTVRDLDDVNSPLKYDGMYPSPGGADESIRLYLYRAIVSGTIIKEMPNALTGSGPTEVITLELMKLEEVWHSVPEAKVLSSLYLYERALKSSDTRSKIEAKTVDMPSDVEKHLLDNLKKGRESREEQLLKAKNMQQADQSAGPSSAPTH